MWLDKVDAFTVSGDSTLGQGHSPQIHLFPRFWPFWRDLWGPKCSKIQNGLGDEWADGAIPQNFWARTAPVYSTLLILHREGDTILYDVSFLIHGVFNPLVSLSNSSYALLYTVRI